MATTLDDVKDRLGRDLTESEGARVSGLLAEAAALVRGYLGGVYPDPVTDVVRVVESRIVARTLTTSAAPGVASWQQSAGQVSQQQTMTAEAASSGGVWLSSTDKQMLSGLRSSMVSVQLGSDRV